MNKLHSFAFYALVAPAITLGAGSVLAQDQMERTDQDAERGAQSTERDHLGATQTEQQRERAGQTGAKGADQYGDKDSRAEKRDGDRDMDSRADQRSGYDDMDSRADQRSDYGDMDSRADQRDGARQHARGYMDTAPANSMQASDLLGANVKTSGDEDLGSVDDLILDQDGQVVAIIVGVGGFLGMGQKDVAIGWGSVTTSGTSDDRYLSVDISREELRSAPKFERRD